MNILKNIVYFSLMMMLFLTPISAQAHSEEKTYANDTFHAMPIRYALRTCGADIATYCPAILPGGGRIVKCLNDHIKDLSSSCRKLVHRNSKMRTAFFACNADASRYCSGIMPGGGRIISCLKDSKDKISNVCKKALSHIDSEYRH